MQTSRAIKKRRDDTMLTGWEPAPDQAPSITREDQPTVARIIALAGLFLILLGLIPLIGPTVFKLQQTVIPAWLGTVFVSIGLLAGFYHAFVDGDRVFRRLYSGIGLVLIASAIALRLLPWGGSIGGYFPIAGIPFLMLGLVLMVATIRGETEQGWRLFLVNLLGILGGLMIVGTVLVALFSRFSFLAGEGVVYLILGLLYVAGFINFQEGGTVRLRGLGAFSRYFVEDRDSVPFLTGFGIGCIGLIAVIGGIVKSAWPESLFLVPDGLILIGAGVLYLGVAAGICLDWPIVILTRRELASLFYSPVAYLVLAGMVAVGWLMLWNFVSDLAESSLPEQGRRAMLEPIVVRYIITIVPVIVQIFVIPAITMRLVAEEKQTGTLEVLLTAPVNEPTVVISKFLAAWFFNFLTWMPWWLNLVALRYMAETEFDYRPILCFNVTLLAVTAGFVSMGVFFSSLTRNQIIAAVLTFVGMMIHLVLYLIRFWVRIPEGTPLFDLLTYVSFLDVWIDSLQGLLAPRYLIFHLSLTIFFLYASIKVLEARKWS